MDILKAIRECVAGYEIKQKTLLLGGYKILKYFYH
jgi:hypothetical protein